MERCSPSKISINSCKLSHQFPNIPLLFSAAHFTIAVSYAMPYFSVTRNNSAEFIFTTFISCEKLEKLYNNVTGSSFRFHFLTIIGNSFITILGNYLKLFLLYNWANASKSHNVVTMRCAFIAISSSLI